MLVSDPETYGFAIGATLALANTAMGAIFTGVARAAYDEAARYARERVQGDVPIARHQAIQLKLSHVRLIRAGAKKGPAPLPSTSRLPAHPRGRGTIATPALSPRS